jgi:hypothetical protein
MDIWLLLGLGPVVIGLVMSLATLRNARGLPVSQLGYGNAHVRSGENQWRAGHQAALPAILGGSAVAILIVAVGWMREGFHPAIGPWVLAAYVVMALALVVGSIRSAVPRRGRTATQPEPTTSPEDVPND